MAEKERKACPKIKGTGPRKTDRGPRHVSPRCGRAGRPAHREAVLLARVVELLPHLGSPRLALFLLAAVFLLQLLALGDLLLQGGDLIADVPNQEAGELH